MTKDEVLMMADVLSREKDIDRGIVFEAIEAALATATRKRNREDMEVRVQIDRASGDYEAFRQWEIVEDDASQMILFTKIMQICLQSATNVYLLNTSTGRT